MDKLFSEVASKFNTANEVEAINTIYPQCKNISIDYGIMEKAENVYVLLSDFGWSDLGTWGSLYTHIDKDTEQNAVVGNKVLMYDASENIVKVPDEKLVVIQGLEGYIVVESNNTLLICKKEEEQKIKQFVADLKDQKQLEFI